jgi:peptidoglycan/xylan/chitin deacetylase (PgdA/CDA1 family)
VPGRLLVLAAVLLAVACGGQPPAPPGSPTSSTPVPSSATATTEPSATATPTSPAPTSPAPTSPAPTSATPTSPAPTSATPTSPAPTSATPTGLPPSLLGQDLRVLPTTRKVVALTFDAGANDAGLARILAALRAEGVRATFFVTGRFAQAYPGDVRAIVAAGHVLGNHTLTHPHSTQITDAELASEVRAAAAAIRAAGGTGPEPWFRFPFGERTYDDVRLLNGLGYLCIAWTVDTLGWLGEERGTAADVTARVLAGLRPGEIVLMHVGSNPDDGTTYDADSLAATIAALRSRGYAFVTVESLLGG